MHSHPGDKEFVDYVHNVVIPRDEETSEYFSKVETSTYDTEESESSEGYQYDDDDDDEIDSDGDEE